METKRLVEHIDTFLADVRRPVPFHGGPFATRETALIFHHIPKTAGSTLESILERHFAPEEIFEVDRSRNIHESLVASVPAETRAAIRLVKGHMDFGVHRFLLTPSVYITVLRHPVERVISHYYYVKRSRDHRLHERVVSTKMSLADYVLSGMTLELNNGQVRSLVGPAHLSVAYGCCTRDMLWTARDNLRSHFSVVGLTERFDETLLLMQYCLGCPRWPYYRARNVSKAKPRSTSLSRDVIKLIEDYNELDLELYEHAEQAFEASVAAYGLRSRLSRFERRNRVLGACTVPYDLLTKARRRWRSNEHAAPVGSTSRTLQKTPSEAQEMARPSTLHVLPFRQPSSGE